MLEGLEAVEIWYSKLFEVIDFRIESEYFEKRFLVLDKILERNKTISFNQIAKALNGRPYSSKSFNQETGIKVSKIGDVTNKRPIQSWEYIDFNEFDNQKGKLLTNGDILMTLTGDPPDVGKINYIDNPVKCTWNQRVAKIKIIDKSIVSSNEALFAILSTEYSRRQLERFAKGIRQRNLGNESLERLRIPIFSFLFQEKIEYLIKNKFSFLEKSKHTYNQVEKLLFEEIGLIDFKPSKKSINIKSFKDSFATTGRLDAEYYLPKYDDLERKIKSQKFVKIKEIKIDNFRGLQPQYFKNGTLNIINSKHILEDTLDYNNFQKTKIEYWDLQERARIFKNDILTYTTGANIGRTQVYNSDEKALGSNHVNILRISKHNPTYIAFTMNSIVGRLQTEKLSAGSAQAELYSKDIDNFLIPIIENSKQQEIADLIEQSFSLKKQSEHLLEVAKKAVEIAIEENEDVALDYINQNT